MADLTKEISAYALQNAIEYGKADPGKVLPKLFQHGLEKENIRDVMPTIQEIVKEVNNLGVKERVATFEKFKDLIKKRTEEKKGLVELPGIVKGKKPVFRLAPFPSGALHIGNAKTYILNALYAEKYNGKLILVMDDTIGSAEKPAIKEGYDLIKEGFKWLKVKHDKPIVYKSSRLKIYYFYAEKLINRGKAYVCDCSAEEVRDNRKKGIECSCRQFFVRDQMKRWRKMFKADEGEMTLRIKTEMRHPNPAFRDRILFKISRREHPKVGRKYSVWPSLEMSWSIDDHLLGVTHIIRGNDLVMETMMEKFIWDIFEWKHPEVIHTGLVKIDGLDSKISKSKAQKEVLSGELSGWDDPRTWSIQSLEKRGITPEAIREFVKDIGLNKQDITIPVESLYALNRAVVDYGASRYSFIANPAKIEIEDLEAMEVKVPVHPDKKKTRKVVVDVGGLLISAEDLQKHWNKETRLLHLFNIVMKDKTKISSYENKKIPRINWISRYVEASVTMPDGKVVKGVADEGVKDLEEGEIIQFERFGFCKFNKVGEDGYEFSFSHK